ncbi:putative non-structural protein 38 [Etheostoma fonticola aquareovirus]|uniref:putative non-structural protein 38 n=1 Tax=Etheostoma fonticola aquareovirus TaxID=1862978 RepID=UPI0007F04CA1|nr:putative non-structural protein 38 [Etheostoma fonticola aquareovirus]ANN11955.1 putative non-structural protein 38 [Etheostoma fonticola aquareovirus]
MAAPSAKLITQENTERVTRLLENYPTLSLTLRQDTSSRGAIESNYSASGLASSLRLLNPIAVNKNPHQPGYVRPDPEATRPPPLRTLINAGLDTVLQHGSQCNVDQALRTFIETACPSWHADVLPQDWARVCPLTLASRISLAASGFNPNTLDLQAPSSTSMVIAYTSKVLGLCADMVNSTLGYLPTSAADAIRDPACLSVIITQYGYETKGFQRQDGPTCISPNDLDAKYDIAWLSAIVILVAYQVELDLTAASLSTTDVNSMATHNSAVETLMFKMKWLAPFSSRIMHLCAANAASPFRSFSEMFLMWQKPTKYVLPNITMRLSGRYLEVIANGAELFSVSSSRVGGI